MHVDGTLYPREWVKVLRILGDTYASITEDILTLQQSFREVPLPYTTEIEQFISGPSLILLNHRFYTQGTDLAVFLVGVYPTSSSITNIPPKIFTLSHGNTYCYGQPSYNATLDEPEEHSEEEPLASTHGRRPATRPSHRLRRRVEPCREYPSRLSRYETEANQRQDHKED